MSVLVAASVARTCLGDDGETFAALLRGDCGVGDLRHFQSATLNVRRGYHLPDGSDRLTAGSAPLRPMAADVPQTGPERPLRASAWLADCVAEAVARAGVDTARERVVAFVGTGLRELRAVERHVVDGIPVRRADLHFAGALRRAAPGIDVTVTISNACSAGGYAVALGQDLLELGEADAVVVAGTDAMTESMLAMIGRFDEQPTDQIRPFDARRAGVLLGEGAAALVLVPEGRSAEPVARLLGSGLSCDAGHETAPDHAGICRAMTDALARAGRSANQVDLVFAHGTGTARNDPTEAAALRDVFRAASPGPFVTAVKGAVGHTSGASALTSLALAVQSLRHGVVPPVVGLREPLPEGAGLRFVIGAPQPTALRLVQVNAFGFGGVNAVSLLEAV